MSKKDQVWVVEEQLASSWTDGYTEDYAVISIHRTKAGAEKCAENQRLDNAVYSLTDGEIGDHKTNPDTILGKVGNAEVAEALRQAASKPGAKFMDAILSTIDKFEIEVADVTVDSRNLED